MNNEIKVEKIDPKLFVRVSSIFTKTISEMHVNDVIAVIGFNSNSRSSRAYKIGIRFNPPRKYSTKTLSNKRIAIKRIL